MPGYNNWFDINLSKEKDNCTLPFEITLNLPDQPINFDFEQASNNVAQLIANQYDNLHLCLSGGLDSEYVASVLLQNKIPFTPVLLITPDNIDEIWYAKHYCYQHNLAPLVIDYRLDYNKLLACVVRYAREINSPANISYFPHVVASHISKSGGTLITGYGEAMPYTNDYDVAIGSILEIEEHDFYLDVSFKNQHPGGFFSYTPDMFFSLIANIDINKNVQLAKSELYQLESRTKSSTKLKIPEIVPMSTRQAKDQNIKCIKIDRNQLMDQVRPGASIILSTKNRQQ